MGSQNTSWSQHFNYTHAGKNTSWSQHSTIHKSEHKMIPTFKNSMLKHNLAGRGFLNSKLCNSSWLTQICTLCWDHSPVIQYSILPVPQWRRHFSPLSVIYSLASVAMRWTCSMSFGSMSLHVLPCSHLFFFTQQKGMAAWRCSVMTIRSPMPLVICHSVRSPVIVHAAPEHACKEKLLVS